MNDLKGLSWGGIIYFTRENYYLPPPKLVAIFNLTPKVSKFSINPTKVSKFFNSGTSSVKTAMADGIVVTGDARDHF
jgi:hypothetical protein